MRLLIPFVGNGDEVAVAVARGDVGEHGRGQGAGVVNFLAFWPLARDRAVVGHRAQHALEFGAHGVFQAEGAGDFAGADFAGRGGDEGENVFFGGEGIRVFSRFVQMVKSCAKHKRR